MGSLAHAKEAVILKVIKDVSENDKRTQDLDVSGSNVWKGKSVVMTNSLADALHDNTSLTLLNLSMCNVGDGALIKLADAIQYNSTLFTLDLSDNKLSRPGLMHFAKCLADNTGLINLDLTGHRINSEVAMAFTEAFKVNMTLCKLLWKLEVGGFTLKFTELTNRNVEIDRLVREDKEYTELLPLELRDDPPKLVPRIVPDPDNEDLGLELGEAATVWCQVRDARRAAECAQSAASCHVAMPAAVTFATRSDSRCTRVDLCCQRHSARPASLTDTRRHGHHWLSAGRLPSAAAYHPSANACHRVPPLLLQVEGKWCLGTVVGMRKRKVVVSVDEAEYDFEPKELTQFEPSHARDLPNMVMMQNLHEAPLLYLLQVRSLGGSRSDEKR